MTTVRLVDVPLWALQAIGAAATLTSPAIDVRRATRLESLMCLFTSVAGTPKIKVEYAVSGDGTAFGAFTDNSPLVADSSVAFATPEGLTSVALPAPLANFIKVKLTELTGALADTLASATLVLREG